ncbi:FAD-binding oxidoreductase [Niabella sp. CC-SYL272]|uniref:NAD(P)/FAD-dependent oxidoreductase n=1 Tax=Niabella agricola TaxID=2891571 RepID=UPI0029E7E9B8|nr:FAD-binding oxidoreductase [Niabella agricola]MCF3108371.1 FAD-binding oxidoreductase [Niabella agricola]
MGAGFTGLWTAIYLRQKFPSKNILVVERGVTPAGASARNAGFACFGSPTEILSDVAVMGKEKALQLLTMRFEGLRIIQKIFANGLIDFSICKGYELLDNPQYLERLSTLNEWLYELTGAPQTFCQQDELIPVFGFAHTAHLVENRFEGCLHPGKLLNALHQLAGKMQIRFLFATEVREVEERPQGVKLFLAKGPGLHAERIVYCTNAFSNRFLPEMDLVPARGQVLLTEPVPGLKFNGTFHYQEGYYYFRNLGNRILLGGARNTSFQAEYTLEPFTTLPIQQALEAFLSNVILPGERPQITHRWAGIMAMGKEKYPIVEQLTDRSFCALRMSGMGVALAPAAGKKIAEMMP